MGGSAAKHSIGNIVNDIVVTLDGVRWGPTDRASPRKAYTRLTTRLHTYN